LCAASYLRQLNMYFLIVFIYLSHILSVIYGFRKLSLEMFYLLQMRVLKSL